MPDIGESSATALSPVQERRLGRSMVSELYQSGSIETDWYLQHYITRIGSRIASANNLNSADFNILLVKEPTINAFALPGGYIGIHSGLIEGSSSEGELASVVAHEMAHVTQLHLARGYQKATSMNLPLTAAVVAAILLGASNPQAAQAIIAGSSAGTQQVRLDFTRQLEREADRVGMQYLANAGYDPHHMPAFFDRIYRERYRYGAKYPEFLLTHPVTEARIADSRNRAADYPPKVLQDESEFELYRAELIVASAKDRQQLIKTLRAKHGGEPKLLDRVASYSYALALLDTPSNSRGIEILRGLLERNPKDALITTRLANALVDRGSHQEALGRINAALQRSPDNPPLLTTLARAQYLTGNFSAARLSLRRVVASDAPGAEVYKLLAKIEKALENIAEYHLALARYYELTFNSELALEQLRNAQKEPQLDFYSRARIDSRILELQEQLEQ